MERLPADELDYAVLKAMLEAYSDSELVDQALEEARGRMPAVAAQLKERLAAIEADIPKTEEALERYFLAFEAGTMSGAACATRIEALGRRLTELNRCDETQAPKAGRRPWHRSWPP